jgi:integrase/recombinase XerD
MDGDDGVIQDGDQGGERPNDLAPTSAQGRLCRRRGYAELAKKVPACWDIEGVEVGMTRRGLVILRARFSEMEEWMANQTSRVGRVLVAGPLASFSDAYRAELERRGYTPWSVRYELQQVARLSRWLDAHELPAGSLTRPRIEQFIDEYRRRSPQARGSVQGLLTFLEVLSAQGVLEREQPAPPSTPTDWLLASFHEYLLSERSLALSTATDYVADARRFLEGLPGDELALRAATAGDVTQAVLRESQRVSPSTAQSFVAVLRSFLRYCFIEGLIEADLREAALTIHSRRGSALPKGITRAHATALLDACDRRRTIGRRDYAVILTLLRLGLRAGEVAGLTLDRIDWRAAEITIVGKRGREDRIPLPADVGAAIAAYLRRGRPSCERREVFLRALAPLGPMGHDGPSTIVRRACRRAGLPEIGAHRLRHTAACEMVSAGVPLQHIGQVLRHRKPVTTAIYARVDLERLRTLAQPWPELGTVEGGRP